MSFLPLILSFLKKYWAVLLLCLVIGGSIFWVNNLIHAKERAEDKAALWQAQVTSQNEAIRGLNESFKQVSKNIKGIETNSASKRAELDKITRKLDQTVDDLINIPPAATFEEACKIATDELRKTNEITVLLPPAS